MLKSISCRSLFRSSRHHTDPFWVPARRFKLPLSIKDNARIHPPFNMYFEIISNLGRVNTSTSPRAFPMIAVSMVSIGPLTTNRTVGMASRRIRWALPFFGFQARSPSSIATSVPSAVVRLRTIIRLFIRRQ